MSKNKLFSYSLNIQFAVPTTLNTEISGEMKVSSAVDSWRLSKETLTIDFHRSKKQTVANIFNTARVNNIQRILLTQFALLGFFPLIEKVTVNGDSLSGEIPRPSSLLSTVATHMQPFLTANEAAGLISSTYSGQAFRAISFLATSTSARCQNDRFRLLWSGFNAIYKPLGNPGAEYLKVNECLKTLEKQGLINRAREAFQEADLCLDDGFWCWDSFLKSFTPLKLKKSKTGHYSVHENAKRVLSDANGEILNALSSQKKYEQWLELLEAGNAIKDRIDGLPRDKGDSFIFIMSYFMYWRRCQTMHGESMSEVFKDEASNRFQKTLNDSLQELLISGIKYCATC